MAKDLFCKNCGAKNSFTATCETDLDLDFEDFEGEFEDLYDDDVIKKFLFQELYEPNYTVKEIYCNKCGFTHSLDDIGELIDIQD